MKRSKIIILFSLVAIIAISFLVLSTFFQNCVFDLLEKLVISIMTSCVIAIPSLIIALYVSSKNTEKTISSIYYSIYVDATYKLKSINKKSDQEILEITLLFSNYSNQIANLRENYRVNKIYKCDELEEHILKLNKSCRDFLKNKNFESFKEVKTNRKNIRSLISKVFGISLKTIKSN